MTQTDFSKEEFHGRRAEVSQATGPEAAALV